MNYTTQPTQMQPDANAIVVGWASPPAPRYKSGMLQMQRLPHLVNYLEQAIAIAIALNRLTALYATS